MKKGSNDNPKDILEYEIVTIIAKYVPGEDKTEPSAHHFKNKSEVKELGVS